MSVGIDSVNVSGIFEGLSVDKLFSVFSIIIIIAIYSIVIFHFYRYIARRNCFKPSKREHSKAIGFLKYFFLFPFVAFLFFMGFSLMLIFLTRNVEIITILYTSFILVVAIRITAYYNDDLSRDVAKMLPFAILAIFLIDSSYFSIDTVTTRINNLPNNINPILQYLILIILVEWILRVGLTIRYLIFPKKEKPAIEEA